MTIIQIRDINDGARIIAGQQISDDAGRNQRRALAERMTERYSDPRDSYVVEIHSDKSIKKYQL